MEYTGSTLPDMSVTLSVPEAAVRLGVSERTVWRRLRGGQLRSTREGRQVRVVLEDGYQVGERAATYESGTGDVAASDSLPWPYTPEKVAAQAARLRARRMAALAEIRRLAAEVKPDPDGLTFIDYLRDEDDLPPGEGAG